MKLRLISSLRNIKDVTYLLLLGINVLGLSGCIPLSPIAYSEQTPVFANHVVQETSGLIQLWSRDDIYVLWGNKTLDASMSTVCFLGDLGKPSQDDQIFCFDSGTGEVKWKRESGMSGILTASPAGIFVARTSFPNTLSKYDLQSGNLIWREEWYESNPLHMLFFDNQIQLITWKPGRDLWVYDTDGKVLKMINNTDAFLTTPDVTFFSENGIRAVRTDTDKVLWDYDDPAFKLMPIFTQDKILSRNESNSGTAYALDRKTGELLWQVRDIVYSSNLAYSPERQLVYALRNNGDLLAIDENTGKINIAARFSSAPFLFIISGTGQAYELAYDQEQHILLVSLGDSHQLYAFKEE